MLLLSLIVPVFNMEDYLEKCLKSILRQDLQDDEYEVILVNDGSKDDSEVICKRYVEKYNNFHLINQKNQGVAVARNAGINSAKGKFIAFIDPDDYLLDGGLNIAFRKYAERDDIDVIHFNFSYDYWDIKTIEDEIDYYGTTHEFLASHGYGLPSFCWIYIYRKEFLDKYDIRFKPYITGEDQLFISTVFIANARYLSCKADIYRYIVRGNSATTNRRKKHVRKCVEDYLNAYNDIINALQYYGVTNKQDVYKACVISVDSKKTFGFTRMLSSSYSYKEFKKNKRHCKEIGFIPFNSYNDSKKTKFICYIENIVINNFLVYKLASWAFNNVVTPYIMPRLRMSFKRI